MNAIFVPSTTSSRTGQDRLVGAVEATIAARYGRSAREGAVDSRDRDAAAHAPQLVRALRDSGPAALTSKRASSAPRSSARRGRARRRAAASIDRRRLRDRDGHRGARGLDVGHERDAARGRRRPRRGGLNHSRHYGLQQPTCSAPGVPGCKSSCRSLTASSCTLVSGLRRLRGKHLRRSEREHQPKQHGNRPSHDLSLIEPRALSTPRSRISDGRAIGQQAGKAVWALPECVPDAYGPTIRPSTTGSIGELAVT